MLARGKEHHKVPLSTRWYGGLHVANVVDTIFLARKCIIPSRRRGGLREGLQGGEPFFFFFIHVLCLCMYVQSKRL